MKPHTCNSIRSHLGERPSLPPPYPWWTYLELWLWLVVRSQLVMRIGHTICPKLSRIRASQVEYPDEGAGCSGWSRVDRCKRLRRFGDIWAVDVSGGGAGVWWLTWDNVVPSRFRGGGFSRLPDGTADWTAPTDGAEDELGFSIALECIEIFQSFL